ncbi:MAG: hypothetical protein IPK17_23065 [Chloroflexi bacterium]|uniref:hypothetical protein n=1 Tax=Candidatus Flexifilum breve TaxID=3140694 RepID=UPI003137106D|nr:hypothetical protein [Chloroflexota bacterium]
MITAILKGHPMRRRLFLAFFILSVVFVLPALADNCEGDTAGLCAGLSPDTIASYPEPLVEPLATNDTAVTDRIYQRVLNPIDIYDAPNGNVVSQLV